MKTLNEIKTIISLHRDTLSERYGISVIGIFGSYVHGEEKAGSDLDLLADVLRPISLLELIGAEQYLSEELGVKVDLVPKRSLREELKEEILDKTVAI